MYRAEIYTHLVNRVRAKELPNFSAAKDWVESQLSQMDKELDIMKLEWAFFGRLDFLPNGGYALIHCDANTTLSGKIYEI